MSKREGRNDLEARKGTKKKMSRPLDEEKERAGKVLVGRALKRSSRNGGSSEESNDSIENSSIKKKARLSKMET